MPRKTREYVVQEDNRDKGKRFQLREWSALQAERWLNRIGFIAIKAGVDVPTDLTNAGAATMAYVGYQFISSLPRMEYVELEPLLNELLLGVRIKTASGMDRDLVLNSKDGDGDDIEEVSTLYALRREVFDLHTGFFTVAALLKSQTTPPRPVMYVVLIPVPPNVQ